MSLSKKIIIGAVILVVVYGYTFAVYFDVSKLNAFVMLMKLAKWPVYALTAAACVWPLYQEFTGPRSPIKKCREAYEKRAVKHAEKVAALTVEHNAEEAAAKANSEAERLLIEQIEKEMRDETESYSA